ncbi:hypothetical protein DEU56DRAFT_789206 [Suillus clintonianus]|uniref:uncharacterized protein n=1 Tax=Suillus clintonianus TaxID=1904413 RepID=UPI001B882A5F|nr:uncharacterized protein DEU56DRAFT_789206 [Suillus clintonianus]KAG2145182.1 hypothetical protein DEU56DRAFT_789206 [Suillus clintonianus]
MDSPSTYTDFLNGSYVFLATMVVLVYDFVIHVDHEIAYWESQKASLTTVSYGLCQALSLTACCVRIPIVFIPTMKKLSNMECTIIDQIDLWILVMVLVCVECIFLIRTYALWGQTRRILYVLAGSYLVILAGAFSCLALYGVAIDKFGGCDLPANTQQPLVAGYILLVVLEIEVLVLSVYKALQLYRASRGTLLVLLVQHNVGYFAACLALNGLNMISAVGVETHDNAMMEVTQIILQALLATRMQIDLWKSAGGRSNSPTDEMTLMEFAEGHNIRQETELVNT